MTVAPFYLPAALWAGLLLTVSVDLPTRGADGVAAGKLIRVGSELCSRMLGSPSISDANLPARVPVWQDTGLDGLVFSLASHEPLHGERNMTGQWWNLVARDYDEFVPEIQAFQAVTNWGRLTDNFLWSSIALWGTPVYTSQDWFNDAHWDILTNNVAIQARIALECNFKGILLDVEQYDHHGEGPWRYPFNYAYYSTEGFLLAGEPAPRPLAEVSTQVYARARLYAETVCDAFPDLTLILIPAIYRPAPLSDEEVLYPVFVDGLLAGLDSQARLVCGTEYTYALTEFGDIAAVCDQTAVQFLNRSADPELMDAGAAMAVGIWTDAGPEYSDTDPNVNHRNPEQHETATRNALAVSQDYAWLYGEKSYYLTTNPTPLMLEYWQATVDAHHQPGTPDGMADVFRQAFPHGVSTAHGGVAVLDGDNVVPTAMRQGLYFDYTRNPVSNGEYRGELNIPLETTDEFTVELCWTVDIGGVLAENAMVLRAYDFTANVPSLLRVEAKEDTAGYWAIEVEDAATRELIPGLSLAKGTPHTIKAHNLGDGTVDLYVEDALVGTYQNLGGTLEWVGNVGDVSTGLGFSRALLSSVFVRVPVVADPGLVIVVR